MGYDLNMNNETYMLHTELLKPMSDNSDQNLEFSLFFQ